MRIRSKNNVRVYEDTTERDALFAPADTTAEISHDFYNEESSGRFRIAASGTATLPLGTVTTARLLFLQVNGECDVTLNGAATPLQMRRANATTASYALKLQLDVNISSVSILNTSASAEIAGYFIIAGDV